VALRHLTVEVMRHHQSTSFFVRASRVRHGSRCDADTPRCVSMRRYAYAA
jgi:hypothetical protein